ncbi:MAG: hypothetical protein AABW87_03360 [Nanoarchaeota archaeon]
MKKSNIRSLIGAILFLSGLLLIIYPISYTGAVIGPINSPSSISFISGLILIFTSFVMSSSGESELESKIKSYRRHLESKEHRKIDSDEAKVRYGDAEKRHWRDVGKGVVRKGERENPLRFIEDYIKAHFASREEMEREEVFTRQFTNSYLADSVTRRLAKETLKNQRLKENVEDMLKLYRKGHNRPGGFSPHHIEGTDGVNEFGSKRGARIYWRGHINNIEIVGLGDKSNQKEIIDHLKKKYPGR